MGKGLVGGLAVALLTIIVSQAALAERSANLLPNPSFESGRTTPDQWTIEDSRFGKWTFDAREGERCAGVLGMGEDTFWWAASGVRLEPNGLYHTSYWVRRGPEATGGAVIAGLNRVNRDSRPGVEWERQEFSFRGPGLVSGAFYRLGQWHVKGSVYFDQASLRPALAVYRRPEGLGLPLGSGETIASGRYTARHEMGGPGSTDCRFLERFTASFNTNRWVFEGKSEVVYRHAVGVLRQSGSEVEVNVNRCEQGSLVVEASGDGERWQELGELAEVKGAVFAIPPELVPARELWVRLRCEGPADLQVDGYSYRCLLQEAGSVERAVGATHYLEVLESTPGLTVEVPRLGDLNEGRAEAEVLLHTRGRRLVRVALALEQEDGRIAVWEQEVALPPDAPRRVMLRGSVEAAGRCHVRLTCLDAQEKTVLWQAEGPFQVSPLYDARGGEVLSDDDGLAIWWCEPERKVSQARPAPERKGRAVQISAAANEYEAAQLVLTPRGPRSGCRLTAGDLTSDAGARIPASQVTVRSVEYVRVELPTDELGAAGEWPDPLPLPRGAMELAAGRNYPFWISVHVPAGTPPGIYRGEIEIAWEQGQRAAPLEVRVWGFELPRETHLRSGFGLWREGIRRYHNLEGEGELDRVFELYLEDFASHRVAPYSVGRGIGVSWGRNAEGELEPELDFAGFDQDARHALDELGFNGFVLRLEGMGGGSFHARYPGEIAGHQQGSPEYEAAFARYARALEEHLAQRGWLDKAYVYWFDEPEEKDYDFVRQGMERIGRAAPGLTRMLTEHPTPELFGAVDVWCLPTYMLDPELTRERQREGEEVWWYLCTEPKAPYFTLFLDHYGTEMRVWLWATWKYGISGILVWQTNYWTSGNAYPEPALQNPWADPMSWKSGYGLGEGGREPWGNGDGRFVYPPNREPGGGGSYREGPVPSIRWELLRDGVEDYEYFWLLRAEIERLKSAGADPAVYGEAEKLLEVPAAVYTDLTEFCTTPEPMREHRAKLAEAIERLRQQRAGG